MLLTGLLILVAWCGSAAGTNNLAFHISSGGNDNYFLRDNVTSAQLLLTSFNNTRSSARRLVVALPAGNSGALAYFLPLTAATDLNISLVNGSLTGSSDDFENAGVQADLAFGGNATLGVIIIGAVRAMRDYVEGSGTMHEIFNYTLNEYNSTSVRLHRRDINTTSQNPGQGSYRGADMYFAVPRGSDARLSVIPGKNGTFTPPKIDILVPPLATNPIVRIRVVTNETSLVGLDTQGLFLTEKQGSTRGIRTALKGLADGTNPVAQQVSFLTYADKFTAGGWRFLTYFGRDSLIALRLLMPLLAPEAIEAALGAVIERANSTGALCHEETVGDYASFLNIGSGQGDLGDTPFYDYKMIDTEYGDLLLLPAVSHYLLGLPQGRGRAVQFLAKNATLQSGTYSDILDRIVNYNFVRAIPFFRNQTYSNLLAFRPGQPVGNWRDSNQGTGYGPIPFDVNSALVPASLRATRDLIDANILKRPSSTPESDEPLDIAEVAGVWENNVTDMFTVVVDEATAEARLKGFVEDVGLGAGILGNANVTRSNVSYYALSLKTDGRPVEVLNSDLGFNLLYGTNVSRGFLQHAIDAMTPYPRGLLTNIGMVVANPAYDSNRTNIQVLDRTAYHGTVVWSFQQAIMASGFARQLGFCFPSMPSSVDINPEPRPKPLWCVDKQFIQNLQDARARLWASIKGAEDHIFSEVWSYSFNPTTSNFSIEDLAGLSPQGTESDAIQLWSYGFLSLLDPESMG